MFSWIASKPAAKEEPPIPKSFDPLKGLGGAVAFYKDVDSQAADAAGSGKLIGSAAAFYANVARERLLEAADAAVPAGSNPSAGNNSTAEICPGVGEINEFLRRGRRCIDSVAPSLADAGEGKAEGGSSVPAPELDLRFGSAAEEPVRWLFKVVIGSEHADLDAIVSAIVYSFFLDHSEPPSARAAGLCLLPLVHTSRADFHLRTDAAWLLQAMGVDTQALLFLDEVASIFALLLVRTSRADFHLRTDAAWLLQAMGVDTQALLFLDEVSGLMVTRLPSGINRGQVAGAHEPGGLPPPHRRCVAAASDGRGGHTRSLVS
ncbi:unnamed protein product [Closterium sp. NIES-65]|nr:unnamed protein product [Closterium sp. NIES-65]